MQTLWCFLSKKKKNTFPKFFQVFYEAKFLNLTDSLFQTDD